MKKLLFLAHIPPPYHGSSIVGEQLYNSKILNLNFNIQFINLLLSPTVKSTGRFSFYKIIKSLKVYSDFHKLLTSNNFDLCYFALSINGYAFYRDLYLVLFLKMKKIPIVFHLHNRPKDQNISFAKNIFYKLVFRNENVILLSTHLNKYYNGIFSNSNIYFCSNGIPEVDFKLKKHYTSNNAIKILFCSNLILNKGLFDLLSICKYLFEANIPFICDIIGSEGDVTAEQLNNYIVEMNLSEHVIYNGPKFGSEKDQFFEAGDIFIFPSKYDCLPLVLIEALQYGLVLVGYPTGGIPDLIIDNCNGYLIDYDIEAAAKKIVYLYENSKLLNEFSENSRSLYCEKFTLSQFENNIKDILLSICKV